MHLAITQPRSQRGLFGRQQRQQVSGRRLAWATTCQRQQQQVELSWGGKTAAMPKAVCVVGRQAAADLQLDAEQVAPEHARLEFKGGRLFCTALTGDPDELLSPTRSWLDGAEMRPGVGYMVAPGAVLAFGTPDNQVTVEFAEQGGSNAMADMLMKGMASQASAEVRQQLDSSMQ